MCVWKSLHYIGKDVMPMPLSNLEGHGCYGTKCLWDLSAEDWVSSTKSALATHWCGAGILSDE